MADAAAGGVNNENKKPEKVKLTKKEKEKAERELRRSLPSLSQVGRNGVFEMIGTLSFTWAQGNVPGGPFVPVSVVCRGHNVYIFEGGEAGHAPSAKPKSFFQVKRADVEKIGLLLIPPLPPHNHVFRLTFAKKQFGHRAFFFKVRQASRMRATRLALLVVAGPWLSRSLAPPSRRLTLACWFAVALSTRVRRAQATTGKDMERWLADLRWRVMASEADIKKRNEPKVFSVRLATTDESESAVARAAQRVNGMAVRYEEREETIADVEDL